MTGTPLLGYKRLQFNIFLKKESKISVMKTLNEDEKLIPLFWVEEVNYIVYQKLYKYLDFLELYNLNLST